MGLTHSLNYNLQINYITFASSTSLDVFVNAKTIYTKHIYKHNNITIISMNQQDVYNIITSNDIDSEQLKESLLIAINNEVKNNAMIDSDNNDRFYENIDEVID